MPREMPAVAAPIELDPEANSAASLDRLLDQLVHGETNSAPKPATNQPPRLLEMDADLRSLLAELDKELTSVSRRLNKALAR